MLKVAKNLKAKVRKIIRGNSRPMNDTKVNYSQLENLPNEILLKIFNYINPKIKELLVFGHMSRRIRSVTHDQSLWQNVNLYRAGIFKNTVPAGLLQLVLENGCRRLYLTCSQIMGTLTLNQESQLEYLRTAGNTNTGVCINFTTSILSFA